MFQTPISASAAHYGCGSFTENGFIPARVIATSFALIAFAAALLVGVYAGNDLSTVIWRGIAILLVCYAIGRLLGALAQKTIDEHTRQHENAHPVPDTIEDLPPSSGQAPT